MPPINVFNQLFGSLFETLLKELEFFVTMKKLRKRQFSLLVELGIFIRKIVTVLSYFSTSFNNRNDPQD